MSDSWALAIAARDSASLAVGFGLANSPSTKPPWSSEHFAPLSLPPTLLEPRFQRSPVVSEQNVGLVAPPSQTKVGSAYECMEHLGWHERASQSDTPCHVSGECSASPIEIGTSWYTHHRRARLRLTPG